jgi:hypothetical protein
VTEAEIRKLSDDDLFRKRAGCLPTSDARVPLDNWIAGYSWPVKLPGRHPIASSF